MKRIVLMALACLAAAPAGAHVVVSPGRAGIGGFQTFTVGVPAEKDTPTVALRLLIPDGVEAVLPNVKSGWKVDVEKAPTGTESSEADRTAARTTEINWTGGVIPPGRRDEFRFSAKMPAIETVLQWRAYQSYADGSVVAWDKDPKAEQPKSGNARPDFSRSGPWSQTRVVNDLRGAPSADASQVPLWLSVAAVVLSLIAILLAWNRR